MQGYFFYFSLLRKSKTTRLSLIGSYQEWLNNSLTYTPRNLTRLPSGKPHALIFYYCIAKYKGPLSFSRNNQETTFSAKCD